MEGKLNPKAMLHFQITYLFKNAKQWANKLVNVKK